MEVERVQRWILSALLLTVCALFATGVAVLSGISDQAGARPGLLGISCVVGYGGPATVNGYQEKRKVPTLLHFGENDSLIPIEQITQFRSRRPDVSAFTYPGATHGFDCDESNGFQEQAAHQALDRTLLWISQYVEGQPPVLLKNAGAYAQAKTDRKAKKKKGGDDMGPPMD